MGIVSIGRSLIIRQLLLTGLVIALGAVAYMAIGAIEVMMQGVSATGPDAEAAGAVLATAQSGATQILMATAAAALLMAAVSIPIIHFTIGRPMKALAAAVDALGSGEHAVEIPGDGRADEIGTMARGLQRIRDKLAAADVRAAVAAVADTPKTQPSPSMAGRVETFSAEMSGHVRRLAAITKRLNETSGSMIVAARHASEGSDQATSASSNAAGDVSSVATASEQLLDSIEEISRQVVQSTSVVKAAVERAVETNAGMGRLSAAAQKVGDVVSLISRIAAQTNLLALNATIEAARAGEAGRGFAVVAQEVKTLATQTAKATQDITGQIAEMQEATELSVEAIDKIQRKISEVEHISTIIAAAVHEQGAATQEIARNVRSAAAGTATMSGHVENIVRSVDETSASATSVAALAREFDEIAATMTTMVGRIDGFAQALVAA